VRLNQKEKTDLQNFSEERDALRKDVYEREKQVRSQINRIRETIYAMSTYDENLGQRLRTLFREQGVTIVSLVTAIGMAIAAVVEGNRVGNKIRGFRGDSGAKAAGS
jgi:ferritin